VVERHRCFRIKLGQTPVNVGGTLGLVAEGFWAIHGVSQTGELSG
jgi:hypothetical protein